MSTARSVKSAGGKGGTKGGGKTSGKGARAVRATREPADPASTEKTRYRVTGSLFLLALAVIVLPMLFDGDGVPAVVIEPISAPRIEPQVPDLTAIAPVTDVRQRVAELRRSVDDDGFLRDSGTRIGEPVLTEVSEETRVWAVQVASFADHERAMRLRDQLRGSGHEAFVSSHRLGDRVMVRVGVGPFLSLDGAETLRIRLTETLSLEARVVAFSN